MATTSSNTQTQIDPTIQPYISDLLKFGSVLSGVNAKPEDIAAVQGFMNKVYPQYQGQQVAGLNPYLTKAFNNISGMQTPAQIDQATGMAGMAGLAAQNIGSTYNQIQGMGPNFYTAPNQNVTAGTVNAPNLNQYQMTQPKDVTAGTMNNQTVNAPNVETFQMQGPGNVAADKVTGAQVNAPSNMQAFQMQGPGNVSAQQVNAPGNLQAYQMGPTERVTTDDYTGQNVQDYMSPYMQQVVQQQKNQAIQDYSESLPELGSAATAVGGLGGSRQALMAAKARQGLQNKLADISATGSQAAFQNAQQQFNTQQQAKLQAAQANQQAGLTSAIQNLTSNRDLQQLMAQQGLQAALANQQTGLQAGLANQQMGYNVGLQNLTSNRDLQQLMAQQGLQAALANQQSTNQANLANQQTGLQARLANQQTGYNVGLQNLQAKQNAQQLGVQTGMQASLANQNANMQSQQTNIQSALQAMLANQNMAYQTGSQNLQSLLNTQQLGSGQNLQAQQLNQNANLQALLANQQAGLQQNQLLAQYGLAGAQLAQQSQQFGANLGLQGLQQQLAAAGILGNLGQQQYQQNAGINQALLGIGSLSQGIEQKAYDTNYQNYMNKINYPYQQLQFLNSLIRGAPQSTSSTTTTNTPDPSGFSQVVGGGIALGQLLNQWGNLFGGSNSNSTTNAGYKSWFD